VRAVPQRRDGLPASAREPSGLRALTAVPWRGVAVTPQIRRRRLVAIGVVTLLVAVLGYAVAGATRGPVTMSPSEVELAIREGAVRDFVRRTGDPSANLGRIDCVELKPGEGNCLADAVSAKHQTDHVMVGIQYWVNPVTGALKETVKMPFKTGQ
jgi:hypothetical protein